MKPLPEALLQSLEGIEGFNRKSFVEVHASDDRITSVRLNPAKPLTGDEKSLVCDETQGTKGSTAISLIPWSRYGFYLSRRPSFTFDPLFHAGCYYVQEASSMFLEQAFTQLLDLSLPLRVLDLCGAPGGKSTHIQSLISADSMLVTNEVIRARTNILTDNIIRWGAGNVMVTNNDPSAFKKLKGFFDVMVIDAPCSGSGLFRRDHDAIDEWSLGNVQLCSQRQQRILAEALPCLKQNGLLIYSTCSFSKEEDECIADWLVMEMGMQNEKLQVETDWKIVTSLSPQSQAECYRFYPDRVRGEGFFLSCFRKKEEESPVRFRISKIEKASIAERKIIDPWIKDVPVEMLKQNDQYFIVPGHMLDDVAALRTVLNVRNAGIGAGALMKGRLVPDHALSMCNLLSSSVPATELSYDDAILYLQRQDLKINPPVKGWQVVRFQNHNLGWINALPNRINNYYPKELRILKQANDAGFEK